MLIRKMKLYMDTVVDIQVVIRNEEQREEVVKRIALAFDAFRKVEEACSRFTVDSEVMKASKIIGEPVRVSPFLFQPLYFARELAEETQGLFDPTVGKSLEKFGYNKHYLTGEKITTFAEETVNFKDFTLNEDAQTVVFKKPMVVDLGAVAKGFAVDLAVNQLLVFPGFMVNAGGDLFAGGLDEKGDKWKVGIQHPKQKDKVIETIDVYNEAVCTSGSYERKDKERPGQHHIIHAETKQSANDWVSCTVIAPFAMMADAFSTATFLLDERRGQDLINKIGAKALFITPELKIITCGGE